MDTTHWVWLLEYRDAWRQRQRMIDELLTKHPGNEYGRARLRFALAFAPGGLTDQEGSMVLGTSHPDGVSLAMHSRPRLTPGLIDSYGEWHPHHDPDDDWLFNDSAAWGTEIARFIFEHDHDEQQARTY